MGRRSDLRQTCRAYVLQWLRTMGLYVHSPERPSPTFNKADKSGAELRTSKAHELEQTRQAPADKLSLLTDFRQALEANICLTREGRHMTPGLSLSMKISSSMSWGPKVQLLLVGKEINLALSVTGAKRRKFGEKAVI